MRSIASRDRMRVVVHRIDAPRVAGAVMVRVPDAVQHRIAHVDVRRRHVDLRAQHVRAVRELARAHAAEQIEVLRRPARSRYGLSLPGFGQRAAVLAHLVGASGSSTYALPVAGSAARRTRRAARSSPTRRTAGRPSRSPSQRTSSWIESTYSTSSVAGFVSSKRRLHVPPKSRGDAEVQADRFGVADVQVAVRLGRKPRGDAAAVLAGGVVGGDDVADMI